MKRALKDKASGDSRNARVTRILGLFVVLCVAFALGFFVRGNDSIMSRLGMDQLSVSTEQNPGLTVSGNTHDSISARVAEVQGILGTYSFDTFDLDKTSKSMLNTMLAATNDPYVHYYDATSYLAYQRDNASGNYGIGVLFGSYKDKAYAVDLFPSSPAQAAGVEVGDFVVAIDGVRNEDGWSLNETVNAVQRKEGSSVVITWRRPTSLEASGGTEFTTSLTCAKTTQENVTSELSDDVGYIKIHQLGRTTVDAVSSAVSSLSEQGAKAYVLDLRDVPGGYLTQAVNLASLFQKSGVVVQIQAKSGVTTKSATGSSITTAPLAILVNGNTAAAAEVLAGALQDNGRATIVGQTTMGKGTVQVIRELSFGGAVSYTAAYYKTPLGRSIDQIGISPDVIVENSGTEDTQKSVALEAAASRIVD